MLMSTENLLLNAVRQTLHGMPIQLMVDVEYSMTDEKNIGTMLLGCISMDTVFHVIAYAIVNHEDERAHYLVIKGVKAAIEAAALKYAEGSI